MKKAPSHFMFVHGKVSSVTSDKALEGLQAFKISFALEFDGADEVFDQAGPPPLLNQLQEPGRIADDVRKEPIHRPDLLWFQGESVLFQRPDLGVGAQVGCQGGLVDADDLAPQLSQNPGPPAGGTAKIQADLAWLGPLTRDREKLP